MKSKSIVIILAFAFVMTLIAGCNHLVENDNQAQVSESEEIQSQEVQSEEANDSTEVGAEETVTISDEATIVESSVEKVSKELTEEAIEIEESTEGKLDIAEINEYGTFDESLKICIQENVALKEGTKIENICWVDDSQRCLRVAIQYEEQPEELWFNHLEDYFFFLKEEEIEVLYVDYGTDIDMERIVWDVKDFDAHLEDVNFDGQDDLIIALGSNGVMYGATYCAYLYTDKGYEYCPSFEQVAYNYRVDNERKCIVATIYPDTADGRIAVEKYYEFKKNEYREIEIYTSSNANAGIRSVEVLDAEEYNLKCVADGKEHILDLEGYPEVYFPHLINPQFGDVTGDGKNDLVLNINIFGNTVCDDLSDTRIYTVGENGLEEILHIDAFGINGIDKWDDKYRINCGCAISKNGELVIDASGDKVDGVIQGYGIVLLQYEDGEFKWVKTYDKMYLHEFVRMGNEE